jgi:hypothetical protein
MMEGWKEEREGGKLSGRGRRNPFPEDGSQ